MTAIPVEAALPVWVIVLGIVGFLVNLIVLILGWVFVRSLADMKEAIQAQQSLYMTMSDEVRRVARDLADHELDAAKTYVAQVNYDRTSALMFDRLDRMKTEIIEQVRDLMGIDRRRGDA